VPQVPVLIAAAIRVNSHSAPLRAGSGYYISRNFFIILQIFLADIDISNII